MALPAIIAGLARVGAAGAEMAGASQAATRLGMVGDAIGKVGQISQQAGQHVGMLGSLLAKSTEKMTAALTLWPNILKSIADPVAHLAAIHNPARVEAFTRALNDAYGVVGRLLTPVMDAFTRSARKLGDFMAGLEPVIAPVMEAVAQLVEHVTDKFIETYRKNAPVFEAMAEVLVKFADVAMRVASAVASAVQILLKPLQFVLSLLGFGRTFDPKASAVGAARREARFVAPKQISDDAIRSSLMQGVGAEKKRTPDVALNDIANFTGYLKEWYEKNGERLISRIARNAERAEAGQQSATEIAFGRWLATRTK